MISCNVTRVDYNERRVISEFNGTDFSIQSFTVLGEEGIPVILGCHYHTMKRETFIWSSGCGEVFIVPVDPRSGAIVETQKRKVHVEEGSVLVIEPYELHIFAMAKGTQFICYSSAPFDPQNQDMIRMDVKPW